MPTAVLDWKQLKFGVEIEFIGGKPEQVELLPGWVMSLDERQLDDRGNESGSELKPPPIRWDDREQIGIMLNRLKEQGAEANWSCGLHVHVGLDPWGESIVLPLVDTALHTQDAMRLLLDTSDHRMLFCPPITPHMRDSYIAERSESALRHHGRPQSHRCGMNAAAWYDIGTVEFRYANGSLEYAEVMNTVELCLRFVCAVGEGLTLSSDPNELARQLGAPSGGYPPAAPAPLWHRRSAMLEDMLIPLAAPLVQDLAPEGEILSIVPQGDTFLVTVELPDGSLLRYDLKPPAAGWELKRHHDE